MRLESVWFFLLLCAVIYSSAQTAESDSVFPEIGTPSIKEAEAWREDSLHRMNPLIPGAGSMVLPGAGQIITGHYVKAGFLLALEAIFVGQAIYWRGDSRIDEIKATNQFNSTMDPWLAQDSLTRTNDRLDSALSREESYIGYHGAMDKRFSFYNFSVWAAGAYIYNVLDAVNSSNFFKNSEPKKPGTAFLLAAVPGLGLGQLYNGSVSKAGMVMMGQFSLGAMAYNSHRLMKNADNNYARLTVSSADSLTKAVSSMPRGRSSSYSGTWGSVRYRAFTNRNMYLWYGIFFYFYSMFDATVDAYLHDYPGKMRIEPDLGVNEREIRFSLYTSF